MRALRRLSIVAAAVALTVGVALTVSVVAPVAAVTSPNHAARAIAANALRCPGSTFAGFENNGVALCGHGDDESVHPAVSLPGLLPGIPCSPSAGSQVHVYFAYKAGRPNRLAALRSQLRDVVAQVDALFNQSASQTRGTRHVRWLMDRSCKLVITPLAVRLVGMPIPGTPLNVYNPFDAFDAVLASHTLGATDHALIFLDYKLPGICGFGSKTEDPSSGSGNQANHYQGTAEVGDGTCRNAVVAAHELGHTLGAVQDAAPHGTREGHCYDGFLDVMCQDTTPTPAPLSEGACPLGVVATLDCGHDDYFSTNPPARSYLATHWNVAQSTLLTTSPPKKWDVVPNPTVAITNVPPGATFVLSTRAPGAGLEGIDAAPTTVTVNPGVGKIAQVDYFIDTALVFSAAKSAPWSGPSARSMLDIAMSNDLTAGLHNLYAVIRLKDGTARTSAVVPIRALDPPALISPDGASGVSGAVPLAVSLPAGSAGLVARVDYTMDSAVIASATSAPFMTQFDSSTAANGNHQFGAILYGADGSKLASVDATDFFGDKVYVANDGSSGLLNAPASGQVVSDTAAIPVSVSVTPPPGRTIVNVEFRGESGSATTDTTAPYAHDWKTCTQSEGCAQGPVTLAATVTFDDSTWMDLHRTYQRPASLVSVRLAANTRLRAGSVVTVPFVLAHLDGAVDSVEVFTKKGYLGEIKIAPTRAAGPVQKSVRVRIPPSWRGPDSIWLRVQTSTCECGLFSRHLPIVWTG